MADFDEKVSEVRNDALVMSDSAQEDGQRQQIEELKHSITIDTLHGDEANKVLLNYTGDPTWTDQEEKKLRRKIDIKLLTILCLTYGLQYYDKA
jgi:hypothetical protein